MDFDLVNQLAIIAEEESEAIYHFTLLTLSALVVTLGLLVACVSNKKAVMSLGFVVLLICAARLAASSVSKPDVEAWPEGVTNDGSFIDTNNWSFVEFRWKLREGYPQDQPVVFKYRPRDLSVDWAALGVEEAGARSRRFVFADLEIPRNPTNYIYLVESSYVPPKLPSIALVSSSISNVTMSVTSATNYLGAAAVWECRRKMWPDTRLPVWGQWSEIGSGFFIDSTNQTVIVPGKFVNERRDTEIRMKMAISDEGTNGVRL